MCIISATTTSCASMQAWGKEATVRRSLGRIFHCAAIRFEASDQAPRVRHLQQTSRHAYMFCMMRPSK